VTKQDASDLSEERTELAEDRTDWAEDRTVMANERTYAGWMRTGMASAALGLGFQAIFKAVEPTWVAKSVATVFIAIGIIIFVIAHRKAVNVVERITAHHAEPLPPNRLHLITGLFVLGSVLLAAVLWSL